VRVARYAVVLAVALATAVADQSSSAQAQSLTIPTQPSLLTEYGRALAIEALGSPDREVRFRAVGAFERFDPGLVAEALIPVLKQSTIPLQRAAIVTILGEGVPRIYDIDADQQSPLVTTALASILDNAADSSPVVRRAVVDVITMLGKTEQDAPASPDYGLDPAIPVLGRLLGDRDVTIRLAVIDALAALNDPSRRTLEGTLRRGLSDADPRVRQRARKAIAGLKRAASDR